MTKRVELLYYRDEALTQKLDPSNINMGTNVDLLEKRTLTIWIYNVGNITLQKITVKASDPRLKVDMGKFPKRGVTPTSSKKAHYLSPQQKGSVTLEWTPKEERDLKCQLQVTGVAA